MTYCPVQVLCGLPCVRGRVHLTSDAVDYGAPPVPECRSPSHWRGQTALSGLFWRVEMGGGQNYGPFLGTVIIWRRIIIGIQKRAHHFDNHPDSERRNYAGSV